MGLLSLTQSSLKEFLNYWKQWWKLRRSIWISKFKQLFVTTCFSKLSTRIKFFSLSGRKKWKKQKQRPKNWKNWPNKNKTSSNWNKHLKKHTKMKEVELSLKRIMMIILMNLSFMTTRGRDLGSKTWPTDKKQPKLWKMKMILSMNRKRN